MSNYFHQILLTLLLGNGISKGIKRNTNGVKIMATKQVKWETSKGNKIIVTVSCTKGETTYMLSVDGNEREVETPHVIRHPLAVGLIGGNVAILKKEWEAIRAAAKEVYELPETDNSELAQYCRDYEKTERAMLIGEDVAASRY